MNRLKILSITLFAASIIFIIFTAINLINNEEKNSFSTKTYSILKYHLPDATSEPLFPTYDDARKVIWIGDSKINSSRIWEFKINTKEFVEHKIAVRSVTSSALDEKGDLWYVDPVSKLLGHYNPENKTNDIVPIPVNSTLTNMVIDSRGNVWISATSANLFMKYDTHTMTFSKIMTPTPHASPVGLAIDGSGKIWAAEAIGKIASIDPLTGKITEYAPSNGILRIPVAVQPNRFGDIVYVSQHGEDAIFSFDINTQTFTRYLIGNDTRALPFGMTFDNDENLWIAEHTIDKIAVFDPKTGSSQQVPLQDISPLTQWITADSDGHIWLAEPGSATLSLVVKSGK